MRGELILAYPDTTDYVDWEQGLNELCFPISSVPTNRFRDAAPGNTCLIAFRARANTRDVPYRHD